MGHSGRSRSFRGSHQANRKISNAGGTLGPFAPTRRGDHRVSHPSNPLGTEVMEMTEGTVEVLVVVSKLKKYIKEKSGMNTSSNVAEAISDRIRELCDQAIESARADGRKTVMDRDFPI